MPEAEPRCLSGSRRSGSRPRRRSRPPPGTAELEELRVRYLGRKAELTAILRGIAELPAEERGKVGGGANQARKAARGAARARGADARRQRARVAARRATGSTSPCPAPRRGRSATLHLITRTTRQIEDVMVGLGYRVMEGPEVEHDYYNFTALNHPPGPPGADAPGHLLRPVRPRGAAAHPHLAGAGRARWRPSRRRSS